MLPILVGVGAVALAGLFLEGCGGSANEPDASSVGVRDVGSDIYVPPSSPPPLPTPTPTPGPDGDGDGFGVNIDCNDNNRNIRPLLTSPSNYQDTINRDTTICAGIYSITLFLRGDSVHVNTLGGNVIIDGALIAVGFNNSSVDGITLLGGGAVREGQLTTSRLLSMERASQNSFTNINIQAQSSGAAVVIVEGRNNSFSRSIFRSGHRTGVYLNDGTQYNRFTNSQFMGGRSNLTDQDRYYIDENRPTTNVFNNNVYRE